MHLESLFIFATLLLAGPATALPRPQDSSKQRQQGTNNGYPIAVAGFTGAVVGAGALAGINHYVNGKKIDKVKIPLPGSERLSLIIAQITGEIEQLKTNHENLDDMVDDARKAKDGLQKVSNRHEWLQEDVGTLERAHLKLKKDVVELSGKVKQQQEARKPLGGRNRNRPVAEDNGATTGGRRTDLTKWLDEGQRVWGLVNSNDDLRRCLYGHYFDTTSNAGGSLILDNHFNIVEWNKAADKCREIPGWDERVKFDTSDGWETAGVEFRSVTGAVEHKPTPQPSSFKDTKGWNLIKNVFSVFSRPAPTTGKVVGPVLGVPSVPAVHALP
ncbi:MAG: hypothetical protein M1816_007155 [Peltula sp. TS41687]|nr:MAG: hypothetical protein M1816_007155 [Peltula sp. TS41687]